MCLSNNRYPEARVDFNDTILLGLEMADGSHVVGYYNKVTARNAAKAAKNQDFGWKVGAAEIEGDFGWHVKESVPPTGNAMLIAIPAEPGTVSAKNLIPVAKYPHFMEDYKKAVAPKPRVLRDNPSNSSFGASKGMPKVVKGFDNGTYDVVLSPSAKAILTVINQIDKDKRPQVNEMLYSQLDLLYPDFTFVLFCFAEEDKERSGCALIKYTPRKGSEHLLYLPGLDGHNGTVETGEVELNHTLVIGSYRMPSCFGEQVIFRDLNFLADHRDFPNQVIGKIVTKGTRAPQGDFLFLLEDVRKGKFRCKRQLPPGWASVFGSNGVSLTPFFIHKDEQG